MKPDGSLDPGRIHLAIMPATKPIRMVQRKCMLDSVDQLDAGVSALRDNRCGCFPDRIFANRRLADWHLPNWRLADDRLRRRRLGMRQIGRHSRIEDSERHRTDNKKFHSAPLLMTSEFKSDERTTSMS